MHHCKGAQNEEDKRQICGEHGKQIGETQLISKSSSQNRSCVDKIHKPVIYPQTFPPKTITLVFILIAESGWMEKIKATESRRTLCVSGH
ncbi:hypothetical protein STEG23_011845 [Scotinomys teguina]